MVLVAFIDSNQTGNGLRVEGSKTRSTKIRGQEQTANREDDSLFIGGSWLENTDGN